MNAPVAVFSSLLLRGGVTSRSALSAERDRASRKLRRAASRRPTGTQQLNSRKSVLPVRESRSTSPDCALQTRRADD